MAQKSFHHTLVYGVIALLLSISCTSPYEFEEETNEDILIVDGMITNQLKKHQIRLSRSYPFETDPRPEKGANVQVLSSDGNIFNFIEKEDFLYEASLAFSAIEGQEYRVLINTRDGKTITSTPMVLPPTAELGEVFAQATLNELDEPGIGVYFNAESPPFPNPGSSSTSRIVDNESMPNLFKASSAS